MSSTMVTEESAFIDRRNPYSVADSQGRERRQFVNSHEELSPDAADLARAIDTYKLSHRRRFINFEEMLAIIAHKTNVFMDLSGWAPKYIPKMIWDEARKRLQDKILFGSDYPLINPQRWLEEFEAMEGFTPEVREKILRGNAMRILKL